MPFGKRRLPRGHPDYQPPLPHMAECGWAVQAKWQDQMDAAFEEAFADMLPKLSEIAEKESNDSQ